MSKTGEDDDMEVLNAALRNNQHCAFNCGKSQIVCKENISLYGTICSLCKLKFCLKHRLPENHGCGGDAKKQARKQHRIQAGGTTGNNNKNGKKSDQILRDKLREKSNKRKKKKK